MFTWLKAEILGMAGNDYLLLSLGILAAMLYLLYLSYRKFKRFHFMHATATSKIRSAAQGLVELKGLGELMPGDTIVSPFSGKRCIWYHCTIEKKQARGKRSSWTNISDECSHHLFRLVDDSGDCYVDPDHAHVVPEVDLTWYGHDPGYRSKPPGNRRLMTFGLGGYRFRERLIRPATLLYALGWFRTVYSDPSDELVAKQTNDLLRQWKRQPQRYLRDYDLDGNGKIQGKEWSAIKLAARNQVLAQLREQKTEHHVISRPSDKRQPYILSALPEETLLRHKRLSAYASASGAFALFSILVVMFSIRPPLPV
jgi:hypothetical protein